MNKIFTVEICEKGIFFGTGRLSNDPIREDFDEEALNNLKKNFRGNIEVNLNHDVNNVIGYLGDVFLLGKKLLGKIVIADQYLDELKDKYISPEIQFEEGKPYRLLALGVVKDPAINNAKIL